MKPSARSKANSRKKKASAGKRPAPRVAPKAKARPTPTKKTKPERKPTAKLAARRAAKPAPKASARPEPKAQQPKPKPRPKAQPKPKTRPKPKAQPKPRPKPKTKPKPKAQPKPKPKAPAKAARAAKPAAKHETKAAPRVRSRIPGDVSVLSQWLLEAPDDRIDLLRRELLDAGKRRLQNLIETARIALSWAWDERPDIFYRLMEPWLESREPRLRRVATGALPLANPACAERNGAILRARASDDCREVRLDAIDALVEDMTANAELVRRFARDDDAKVRELVARHLHLASDHELIFPLLRKLCADPSPEVHSAAAFALYDLYERFPKESFELGREMANHTDPAVRRAVAQNLFEHVFADQSDQMYSVMRQWARSGDGNLRFTLAHSLRFCRGDKVLPVLKHLYNDQDPAIRQRVVWQVAQFLHSLHEITWAAHALRHAREDPVTFVRKTAEEEIDALGIDLDSLPLAPPALGPIGRIQMP